METVDILLFTDCLYKIYTRPGGAYRIATELRKHGYTVQVVDHFILGGLNNALNIIDKFVGHNTIMVGFSTTFMDVTGLLLDNKFKTEGMFDVSVHHLYDAVGSQRGVSWGVPISDDNFLTIKNRVLKKSPKAKLVIGGTKAEYVSQMYADAYIVGYADTSVVEFAKYLTGENPFFQYRRADNGSIIVDNDIDATSFEFVNSKIEYEESDFISKEEPLLIEVSRGCIFKCKFCSFRLIGKHKGDYIKESNIVYDEMIRNYEKFGTTRYIFSDDTYNDSIYKIEKLAEVYQRLPFKIEFAAYIRHDLINRFPDMADILKESGLKSAIFGIETRSHTAGKIIGKGLDPERTRELLQWLRTTKGWKNNILMNSGFIVGLPTENYDTVSRWAEEVIGFDFPLDSISFHPLGISPDSARLSKSEFERNYEKYGYYFDKNISKEWINEHWRYEEAAQLSNEIGSYAFRSGRMKSYGHSGMMLFNYGITDWTDILNKPAWYIERNIQYKTLALAENYHKKLLK